MGVNSPVSPDEKKDGISFGEYVDLFFDISEDDALSDDEVSDKLDAALTARGIPEARQTELVGELLQAFHNPRTDQPTAA